MAARGVISFEHPSASWYSPLTGREVSMKAATRTVARQGLLLGAAFGAMLAAEPAPAADYFGGKTIELVVGGDAGGGYDIYARAVARHLARHIGGNPNVVVKNMPGAGSTRAGIYISTVAPKDGTSI